MFILAEDLIIIKKISIEKNCLRKKLKKFK